MATPTAMLTHWRRWPARAADWFDADELAQARAYNRPADRWRMARSLASGAVLVAWIVGQLAPRLVDALDVTSWIVQLVAVAIALELSTLVVTIPFDLWRQLSYDRRWGLSNQTGRGFLVDLVRELAVGLVINLVLLVPLWAVIRATDLWWLFGWVLFATFTVLLGLLWPVVIAPVFNKFTPLEGGELADRILAVARRTDLPISGVLVADASRRSNAGNAYVAGLGRTRRVVVFDTLLDWPVATVEQVVAHELGHWRFAHLRRKLPVLITAELGLFVLTWLVLRWDGLLSLAGVDSVREPAALPLFMAVFPLGYVLLQLGSSYLSRADERQADLYALEVLAAPEAFSDVFRRLAEVNKADIDPSWWKRATATHPPIPERLAMARAWAQAGPR